MAEPEHYVIIGSGVAGGEAAFHLRQRAPEGRITMVTAGQLLSINRYELPKLFTSPGLDWRDFLLHPPEYYQDQDTVVRRNTWVSQIDAARKQLVLRHREALSYDKLLIASGGGRHIPEVFSQYRDLMMKFGTYEEAKRVADALPEGGHMVMLGGDMIGLDLARWLVKGGFKVTVIGREFLFWPHRLEPDEKQRFAEVLRRMGVDVVTDTGIASITEGKLGAASRRVLFDDGEAIDADILLSFCGLMPSLAFMAGAGVDIERGVLVDPHLRSTDKNIWAAGDVCQIWSPEERQYRFYYGWGNVKEMGRIAAFNMTGGDEPINTFRDERLVITDSGEIDSPYWHFG